MKQRESLYRKTRENSERCNVSRATSSYIVLLDYFTFTEMMSQLRS